MHSGEAPLIKHAYRILAAILLLGFFATILIVRAAGPKTEMVKLPSGKDTIEGYLAVPDKPGRYPAVIVIHEWWGLNDWVKEQTQKIAELGYVALAVDLYRGKTATTPEEAHELMRGLPQDRAVRDLQAGYDYLATRKDVGGHVAAIGWCMGGGYALQLAIHQPRLAACVVNYGALPTDPNDIQQIAAPVLGNFGAEDHGITPADVKAFQKTLSGLGRYVDIKIYDGAGHAFENPNNEKGYRPEDAADAWARTVVFLKKTIGAGEQAPPAKK
jgi:carboxymethylenebutenolidase